MRKKDALAYLARYRAINRIERREMRRTSVKTRAIQLNTMMALARQLNWATSSPAETRATRARWNRLRKYYDSAS